MAKRIIRCRPLLGTFVEITAESEQAIEAGFDAIALVHRLMSAHEPDSDISRINRFGHWRPTEVHPWTAKVLRRSLYWAKASGEAFDVVAAGAGALGIGYIPRHFGQPLPESRSSDCLRLDGCTVSLECAACIDVGGIAKGFAVDQAIAGMRSAHASFGLVNAGGDLAGFGSERWPIHLVHPRTRASIANVAIENGALATSALLPDGTAEHLPGRSAELISATVCAPHAIDADALTKIVLSGGSRIANCLELAGAQAILMHAGGTIATFDPEQRAA